METFILECQQEMALQEKCFITILNDQRDSFTKEVQELRQQHEGQVKALQNSIIKECKITLQQYVHDLKSDHSQGKQYTKT